MFRPNSLCDQWKWLCEQSQQKSAVLDGYVFYGYLSCVTYRFCEAKQGKHVCAMSRLLVWDQVWKMLPRLVSFVVMSHPTDSISAMLGDGLKKKYSSTSRCTTCKTTDRIFFVLTILYIPLQSFVFTHHNIIVGRRFQVLLYDYLDDWLTLQLLKLRDTNSPKMTMAMS